MMMMSLVVMLFWSLSGVFWGLLSFLVTMIFLYRYLLGFNPYYYSVLIMAFFFSSSIGYYISRKISLSNQKHTVSKEKIQEDVNLILNHKENRGAEVSAMGEKIVSLLKLKNIADQLSLSLTEESIIEIVSKETLNIFKDKVRILFFEYDKEREELKLNHALKTERRNAFAMKNGGIFERWVLKNMKSLLVRDIKEDFRFSVSGEETKDDTVSLMIKPLVVENNVLGILRVDSLVADDFNQHELRILDIIGELTAVALENARLYNQTEELAIKDSLTGLYVHRYFMERLEEEVKRALLGGRRFVLLMLDIDNFKEFNDKYGHVSGDVILRKIGRVLSSKAAAGDVVARYGGEEFAFLSLGSDKESGKKLAEEIRDKIESSVVTIRREQCKVTVSVGIAAFPDDAKQKEDIIGEADKCLYRAKSEGKNRVCSK
ncbi:MAG: sensor domain-containing diguanylate cyclase [Candidatus Omnitrophica bacterium]|nr:sensor domain-containing diguanylate cyclase [Candidatus Omnitrophota bacterium]